METFRDLVRKFGGIDSRELTDNMTEHLYHALKEVRPEEIRSAGDGKAYLLLLAKFREHIGRATSYNGAQFQYQLKSILSVGEDGLYSDHMRFLFELIQNVDDCSFPTPEDCQLRIFFDSKRNTITLRYNETGFEPFHVFAITGIAEAAKNLTRESVQIGEKGIGFKSVFGVANRVRIKSGWFSFELHRDNYTIPIPAYDSGARIEGTEMTLFLSIDVKSIYRKLNNTYCNKDALFTRNPLLFLNRLSCLKLYDDRNHFMEFYVTRAAASDEANITKIRYENNVQIRVNMREQIYGKLIQNAIACTRYSYPVFYSPAAFRSRYQNLRSTDDTGMKRMVMRAVFPNPENVSEVKEKGALYSYLPTQVKLTAPIALHVPFKLDASREYVDPQDNNAWFTETCGALEKFLDTAYKAWSKTVCQKIPAWLPPKDRSLFGGENRKVMCLVSQRAFQGAHYLSLPLFHAADGVFHSADEIICFERTEHIQEPERVYRLLGLERALFLPQSSIRHLGLLTEHNVYDKLCERAFLHPSQTREILEYLQSVDYEYQSDMISHFGSCKLIAEQIETMFQDAKLADVLQSLACSAVKERKQLPFEAGVSKTRHLEEVLHPLFAVEDTSERMQSYFSRCDATCVLLDLPEDGYLPCTNAVVLSKNNPLRSFSAFCSRIDRNNMMVLRMQVRESEFRLTAMEQNNTGSAEDYIRTLSQYQKLTKEVLRENAYRQLLELIKKSGANRERFLLELLQNADDCDYPAGTIPTFQLKQIGQTISTSYNETGFQRRQIRAITSIAESTKKQLENHSTGETGEKGVGFKSVFSVASKVSIYSGEYAFALTADRPTIPVLIKRPDTEEGWGTRMDFALKGSYCLPPFTESSILEACLCLKKLKSIRICDYNVTIADTADKRTVTINNHVYAFQRFAHHFTVNDREALEERTGGTRTVSREQTIVCYLPEKKSDMRFWLYNALPTTHRVGIPLAIDAPFALTTSREQIELDSAIWNCIVRREMYEAILSIIDSLKVEQRDKIIRLIKIGVQRHGTETKYVNDLFDSEFLRSYPFLGRLRASAILPTCNRAYFAVPQENSALRFPDVALYLFRHLPPEEYAGIEPCKIIDADGKSWEAALNALNCRTASFREVIPFLERHIPSYMEDPDFRQKLYDYLRSDGANEKEIIKQLPVIPVFGKVTGQTEYIAWTRGRIFVKPSVSSSPPEHYYLNTAILPKADCEAIIGSYINEMNEEYERTIYNDKLADLVQTGDLSQTYFILMAAFKRGTLQKYRSFIVLNGLAMYVPMKNELGEISRGRLFLSEETKGYYPVEMLQRLIVHPECKEFARRMQCPYLWEVTYADLDWHEPLAKNEVEFLSEESFIHSDEILRSFYRDGLVTEEQLADAKKDYLVVRRLEREEENYEFPSRAVTNWSLLASHIRRQWDDPIQVKKEEVRRIVKMGKAKDGRTFELDGKEARQAILSQYRPENRHDLCFCQMCRSVKPKYLIEVNALELLPDFYFQQMRICLCLDCSKTFTYLLRSRDDIRTQYLHQIKTADIGANGIVKIRLDDDHDIWFTGEHIAEIQEILKQKETGSDNPCVSITSN